MIHVDEDNKLIFVRGVYALRAIEKAYTEQTGKVKWNWRSYTIVGLADERSTGLQAGMPYQPIEAADAIGFKYAGKDKPSTRTSGKGSGKRKRS